MCHKIQGSDDENNDHEEEEGNEAVITETAFGDLRDHVMAGVQENHSYLLLPCWSQDICEHFIIDTVDITAKGKALYISRLENFQKQCCCCPI